MTTSTNQRLVSFKPFSSYAARLILLAVAFYFTLPGKENRNEKSTLHVPPAPLAE